MNDLKATSQSERIPSLDFLRGIAILGILFINIENFAYPDSWSPWKFGFESSIDRASRFWVYFLTQGKFYTMFTLLFGVGFYIFLERLSNQGLGLKAMDIYARRLLWLFVIGVGHAYLIWDGDVLYHYAFCGFILFPFRSISSKNLLLIVGLLLSLILIKSYDLVNRRVVSYQKYETAMELSRELTAEEQKRATYWENKLNKKAADTTTYPLKKETYLIGLKETYNTASVHKEQLYLKGGLFRSLILMILGIILYRSGIFRDYRVWKNYWIITLSLLSISLSINYLRYDHWTYHYHEPILQGWKEMLFTFAKELMGISYVLVLNGIYQKYLGSLKVKMISKIGRMALSNYIFQNILLGLIFYGYGLGKFNQYSRFELLGIVLIIWMVQLALSWLWMKNHTQGPLERVWRKLTYASFKN